MSAAVERGTEEYLGVEGVTIYFVAVVGALIFGLSVIVVDGALFVDVDVNSDVGGCAGFVFEAVNFGVYLFVGVGALL